MKLSLVILTFSLFFANSLFAQEANSNPSSTKSKQTISGKIKTFKKNRSFTTEYDKFEDKTYVAVSLGMKNESFSLGDLLNETATDIYGIDLYIAFSFEGKELKDSVENLVARFSAKSRALRWSSRRDFTAIADDERIRLDSGKYRSSSSKNGSVNETLTWAIPIATFEKIANAKKVEIRVGKDEVKFKPEQLQNIKDLISLTKKD